MDIESALHLLDLPPELVCKIMAVCPGVCFMFSMTCTTAWQLSDYEIMWRGLYAKKLPCIHFATLLEPTGEWKFGAGGGRQLLYWMNEKINELEGEATEIPVLIEVLRENQDKICLIKAACYAIRRLSFWREDCSREYLQKVVCNRQSFLDLDTIPLLVEVLERNSSYKELAARVFCSLGNVICNDQSRQIGILFKTIPLASEWIINCHDDYDTVDYGTYLLFKICCKKIQGNSLESRRLALQRKYEIEGVRRFSLDVVHKGLAEEKFIKCHLYFLASATSSTRLESSKEAEMIEVLKNKFGTWQDKEIIGYLIFILKNLCSESDSNRALVSEANLLPKFIEILHAASDYPPTVIENAATLVYKILWTGEHDLPDESIKDFINLMLKLLAINGLDASLKCLLAAILADCAYDVQWVKSYILEQGGIPLISEAAKSAPIYSELMAVFQ